MIQGFWANNASFFYSKFYYRGYKSLQEIKVTADFFVCGARYNLLYWSNNNLNLIKNTEDDIVSVLLRPIL
ncbi:MAG TPA: hypothetical protein PLW71_01365, partial [Candidatus Syntrophosphaera thermopropionivorans]|nr:hypothetical protein [Candidatus Syntrophosphaera thermopropionivorans]